MIVNLTLKPTQYKAVNTATGEFSNIQELFGTALLSSAEEYSTRRRIVVNINNERTVIPCTIPLIIIAEFMHDVLTGVFCSDDLNDLVNMFDWEGEL